MKKFWKAVDKKLTRFMNLLSDIIGRPYVFIIVLFVAAGWFVASMTMEYETWFDIMDVFVFLTTFFLLFVIQSSQNADTAAMQDKLDEIIEALPKARKKKEAEEKRMKRGEKKVD